METVNEHAGDRRQGERRRDYRGARDTITLRQDPEFKTLLAELAKVDEFRVSTTDLVALLLSAALGLAKPPGRTPNVPVDLDRLPDLAARIIREHGLDLEPRHQDENTNKSNNEEVLRRSA